MESTSIVCPSSSSSFFCVYSESIHLFSTIDFDWVGLKVSTHDHLRQNKQAPVAVRLVVAGLVIRKGKKSEGLLRK